MRPFLSDAGLARNPRHLQTALLPTRSALGGSGGGPRPPARSADPSARDAFPPALCSAGCTGFRLLSAIPSAALDLASPTWRRPCPLLALQLGSEEGPGNALPLPSLHLKGRRGGGATARLFRLTGTRLRHSVELPGALQSPALYTGQNSPQCSVGAAGGTGADRLQLQPGLDPSGAAQLTHAAPGGAWSPGHCSRGGFSTPEFLFLFFFFFPIFVSLCFCLDGFITALQTPGNYSRYSLQVKKNMRGCKPPTEKKETRPKV